MKNYRQDYVNNGGLFSKESIKYNTDWQRMRRNTDDRLMRSYYDTGLYKNRIKKYTTTGSIIGDSIEYSRRKNNYIFFKEYVWKDIKKDLDEGMKWEDINIRYAQYMNDTFFGGNIYTMLLEPVDLRIYILKNEMEDIEKNVCGPAYAFAEGSSLDFKYKRRRNNATWYLLDYYKNMLDYENKYKYIRKIKKHNDITKFSSFFILLFLFFALPMIFLSLFVIIMVGGLDIFKDIFFYFYGYKNEGFHFGRLLTWILLISPFLYNLKKRKIYKEFYKNYDKNKLQKEIDLYEIYRIICYKIKPDCFDFEQEISKWYERSPEYFVDEYGAERKIISFFNNKICEERSITPTISSIVYCFKTNINEDNLKEYIEKYIKEDNILKYVLL